MKTVVCGVGNELRGDDSFGPLVIKELEKKALPDTLLLNCGTAPENFLGKIEKLKPEKIIILDSVEMGKKPGSLKEIPPENIKDHLLTTHKIPLIVFIEKLKKSTDAEIIFLGCQPKSIGFGKGISRECRKAARKAAENISI